MLDKNNGFSLIELIIVLVIISIFVSLIGPEVIFMVDRSKLNSEIVKVQSIIKTIKVKSFCQKKTFNIEVENQFLIIKDQKNKKINELMFKKLFFKKNSLVINPNGWVNADFLEYGFNGEKKIYFYE